MPKDIPMTPVASSLMAAVGYDEESTTLAVQFKSDVASGTVYHYDGVSPEKYAALTSAESIGRHFLQNIKSEHQAEKISKETDDAGPG